MFNIKIETAASYVGRTDTYTIQQEDKSIPITHEVGGFMHKKAAKDLANVDGWKQ